MANTRRVRATSGGTEPKAPKPGAEGAAYAPSEPDQIIAKKLRDDADDPDEVRKALDDAAGMSRNLWLAFLSFGTFLVVTVGAVNHRELLRESPIKLPLLNVELPLFTFFWVAPLLVLIFHAYLLLNLKLMVDNVHRFNAMLKSAALNPKEDDNFRLLLTNFPFVQLLAGTSYARQGFLSWLLATIVWITVVFAPLVLLLLMQLQFLPYHSSFVTWVQRIVIAIDLALLWYFWPRIMDVRPRSHVLHRTRQVLAIAGMALVAIFSFGIATFPGEWHDKKIPTVDWFPWPHKIGAGATEEGANTAAWTVTLEFPYELLFLGEVDQVTGSRSSLWSNTIVVPDVDLVDDTKLDTLDRPLSLRGRDLRRAVLVRTDMRKADFTGAILNDADLSGGRFDEALFYCATKDLPKCTSLLNAKLDNASLKGAKLHNAHLEGASLKGAKLQLADLTDARLQAANLDAAQLHLAKLNRSDLQGASLKRAQLHGADVSEAHLEGATLASAVVWHVKHENSTMKLTDVKSLIESKESVDDEGQATPLDTERVIKAAIKDTSKGLALILNTELGSLLRSDSKGPEKFDTWQGLSGEQVVSDENLEQLAEFIGELGCNPKGAPQVVRGLIVNNRVGDMGRFADRVEKKFLDPSCQGAADLTSAEKKLLREQVSAATDHKQD